MRTRIGLFFWAIAISALAETGAATQTHAKIQDIHHGLEKTILNLEKDIQTAADALLAYRDMKQDQQEALKAKYPRLNEGDCSDTIDSCKRMLEIYRTLAQVLSVIAPNGEGLAACPAYVDELSENVRKQLKHGIQSISALAGRCGAEYGDREETRMRSLKRGGPKSKEH